MSLAGRGGGGSRPWRRSGSLERGASAEAPGPHLTRREPEREKGHPGARKWVQRALEEARELGESWGHSLSLPLGADWWPGASELCSARDKREPRAGTEPGAALKGSVRWRWHPGLLMGPAPEELVSVKPGIRSSLQRARDLSSRRHSCVRVVSEGRHVPAHHLHCLHSARWSQLLTLGDS